MLGMTAALSVVDIFDTNKYAHDPREDFLNWSILDVGAFDYAADAWGTTYGAAAEWYQGRYADRVGLFDLSSVPNSIALSLPLLHQTQFVLKWRNDTRCGTSRASSRCCIGCRAATSAPTRMRSRWPRQLARRRRPRRSPTTAANTAWPSTWSSRSPPILGCS
jgi:hypothetical protein